MTRTEYEAKRKALINEADALINEGKVEEANKKMDNVTELDQGFEEGGRKLKSIGTASGTFGGSRGRSSLQ